MTVKTILTIMEIKLYENEKVEEEYNKILIAHIYEISKILSKHPENTLDIEDKSFKKLIFLCERFFMTYQRQVLVLESKERNQKIIDSIQRLNLKLVSLAKEIRSFLLLKINPSIAFPVKTTNIGKIKNSNSRFKFRGEGVYVFLGRKLSFSFVFHSGMLLFIFLTLSFLKSVIR